MFKITKTELEALDTERAAIEKQIQEFSDKLVVLDEKRNNIVNNSLQSLTDDQCAEIEEAVFKLFKLYNYETKSLATLARERFSIVGTALDGAYIRFSIKVANEEGLHEIAEHHGVFKDFDTYFALRKEAIRTTKQRSVIRQRNNIAMEKVNDYINALPSDL